jgi:hypothetical protein
MLVVRSAARTLMNLAVTIKQRFEFGLRTVALLLIAAFVVGIGVRNRASDIAYPHLRECGQTACSVAEGCDGKTAQSPPRLSFFWKSGGLPTMPKRPKIRRANKYRLALALHMLPLLAGLLVMSCRTSTARHVRFGS